MTGTPDRDLARRPDGATRAELRAHPAAASTPKRWGMGFAALALGHAANRVLGARPSIVNAVMKVAGASMILVGGALLTERVFQLLGHIYAQRRSQLSAGRLPWLPLDGTGRPIR